MWSCVLPKMSNISRTYAKVSWNNSLYQIRCGWTVPTDCWQLKGFQVYMGVFILQLVESRGMLGSSMRLVNTFTVPVISSFCSTFVIQVIGIALSPLVCTCRRWSLWGAFRLCHMIYLFFPILGLVMSYVFTYFLPDDCNESSPIIPITHETMINWNTNVHLQNVFLFCLFMSHHPSGDLNPIKKKHGRSFGGALSLRQCLGSRLAPPLVPISLFSAKSLSKLSCFRPRFKVHFRDKAVTVIVMCGKLELWFPGFVGAVVNVHLSPALQRHLLILQNDGQNLLSRLFPLRSFFCLSFFCRLWNGLFLVFHRLAPLLCMHANSQSVSVDSLHPFLLIKIHLYVSSVQEMNIVSPPFIPSL